MHYDIFNGDADGIFALHQYRLENPLPEVTLITGVKRDIGLLSRVAKSSDDSLTVFDISLDSNRDALLQLLARNNSVTYFDHHFAGTLPESPLFQAVIDPSPRTCTSLIINKVLSGAHSQWAICGAFGDNLHKPAGDLAQKEGLNSEQTDQLRELGELFNYNGYGSQIEDLHYHPGSLLAAVRPFENPFDFIENATELVHLRAGYREDLDLVMEVRELETAGKNRIYKLPDTPWARRVTGVFSNIRARERADAAHAVITENKDRTLRISVRAPLDDQRDADTLCKLFPSGGGRTAAAGINSLPADQFDLFVDKFQLMYR